MRILFGPEEDVLHIDPQEPNGYEWWYFDAISDDERYILVAIFFLGSPMSPYYKAVVDGKNPFPKDWCGVFFTLHERTPSGYVERAYTYNLYSDDFRFASGTPIRLGDSELSSVSDESESIATWNLKINERNLWRGSTRAKIRFDSLFVLKDIPSHGEQHAHNWVCVAPHCRVEGTITLSGSEAVAFRGTGYHDHNYGMLPWTDMDTWRWERVHFIGEQEAQGAVHYSWLGSGGKGDLFAVWNRRGDLRTTETGMIRDSVLSLGIAAPASILFSSSVKRPMNRAELTGVENVGLRAFNVSEPSRWSLLQSAPFYSRSPIVAEAIFADGTEASGIGISEQFRPAGLAGPIMSRALWTRIRRRS